MPQTRLLTPRTLLVAVALLLLFLALLQLVPYGRDHTNPPVGAEPQWDSPQTRALAVRACFDCHSNETVWPWYSKVAPMSWLIQRDVNQGRRSLDFSEWDRPRRQEGGGARTVERGSMPPSYYVWLHPTAGLSSTETQALVRGLQAVLGAGGGGD